MATAGTSFAEKIKNKISSNFKENNWLEISLQQHHQKKVCSKFALAIWQEQAVPEENWKYDFKQLLKIKNEISTNFKENKKYLPSDKWLNSETRLGKMIFF